MAAQSTAKNWVKFQKVIRKLVQKSGETNQYGVNSEEIKLYDEKASKIKQCDVKSGKMHV